MTVTRFVLTIFAAGLLAGCATNRSNVDDYEVVSKGQVPPDRVKSLRDCTNDAFRDRTIGLGVTNMNRGQRRDDMWRIELVNSEFGATLSADLFDDGRFELYEITRAIRGRVQDERAAFISCARRLGATFSSIPRK